jgi:hypothetical protein
VLKRRGGLKHATVCHNPVGFGALQQKKKLH